MELQNPTVCFYLVSELPVCCFKAIYWLIHKFYTTTDNPMFLLHEHKQ